jgi:hypothetical protein
MKQIKYAILTLYLISLTISSLPARAIEIVPIQLSVKDYVINEALKYGVNTSTADFIIKKESSYCDNGKDYNVVGDDGNSRGCWQISKIYHPEVSDSCANNLECSTKWSLLRIKAGYANEWSTWKYRNVWYK